MIRDRGTIYLKFERPQSRLRKARHCENTARAEDNVAAVGDGARKCRRRLRR